MAHCSSLFVLGLGLLSGRSSVSPRLQVHAAAQLRAAVIDEQQLRHLRVAVLRHLQPLGQFAAHAALTQQLHAQSASEQCLGELFHGQAVHALAAQVLRSCQSCHFMDARYVRDRLLAGTRSVV